MLIKGIPDRSLINVDPGFFAIGESQPLHTAKLYAWWRHQMETFSALLTICAGNSPVPDEFPTQRPVTRSFDVHFDLRPNKRLSKQSCDWWFETQSHPLWHHLNEWGHIVLSCTSQHIHTAPMFIDLPCNGSWFIIFDFLIFSITSFRCSYSLVVALTQSLHVLVWGKVRGNVIKVPRVERLEFPRDFFSNGPWRDTGGSVHPGRHQGPLLLTWINFDPSMDK